MKLFILLSLTLFLVGCKTDIDTRIKVVEGEPFVVTTSDGEKLQLPVGEMDGELTIDGKHPESSYLTLHLRRNNKKFRPEIPLRLPNIDILLGSNDPVRLDSKSINQSFGVMVMREFRPKKDRFIMTFHNPDFTAAMGEMMFDFETDKVLYDENKKEFLASYQKVKRKQRGVMIRIDGEVDDNLSLVKGFGWVETVLDHIVNYGGAALISPWAYARYSTVNWMIGGAEEEVDLKKWKAIIKELPVVDYFAFVHSGNQHIPKKAKAEELELKKNQLRAVYTGACYSKHGTEWLKDYGAVVAGGQRSLSASPLFQFTAMRRWVYGFNFQDALIGAYQAGVRKVRALEWITFAKFWEEKTGMLAWKDVDDMMYSSEILFSYTKEIPAKNLEIGMSAILSKMPEDVDIIKKGAIEVTAENNGELYIENKKVH